MRINITYKDKDFVDKLAEYTYGEEIVFKGTHYALLDTNSFIKDLKRVNGEKYFFNTIRILEHTFNMLTLLKVNTQNNTFYYITFLPEDEWTEYPEKSKKRGCYCV